MRHRFRAIAMLALGVSLGSGVVATGAQAQTPGFHLIGTAPGTTFSTATCVSADGRVVGGYSFGGQGFVWTEAAGRYDLRNEPGLVGETRVSALSGDGTTVAGSNSTGTLFRWSGLGTFQLLGKLPTYAAAEGRAVSNDGSVIVGVAQDTASSSRRQAFRWTPSGGIQGLGFAAPGHGSSEATGITRDGSTIVGWSRDSGSGVAVPVKWTSAGVQVLPSPEPQWSAEAYATNGSGTIIVGSGGQVNRALMWTNGAISPLGVAPGWTSSVATSVSDDGGIVVSKLYRGIELSAGIWTPATGMVTLTDYLVSNGLTVPAGWTLGPDFAVSGDGRTFVGRVTIPGGGVAEGIVITIPGPGSIALVIGSVCALVVRRRR